MEVDVSSERRQEVDFSRTLCQSLPVVILLTAVASGVLFSFSHFWGVLGGGLVVGMDFLLIAYTVNKYLRPDAGSIPWYIIVIISMKFAITALLFLVLLKFLQLPWVAIITGITSALVGFLVSTFYWLYLYRKRSNNG